MDKNFKNFRMKFLLENIERAAKRQSPVATNGFTLVEILVVMGIIAMLSTLAVNGYISYRRTALLDLGADNLISQINRMKSKATYGSSGVNAAKFEEIKGKLDGGGGSVEAVAVGDDQNKPQCYGVVFESSAVKSFSVDFFNTKVWKPGKQSWEYQGCEDQVGDSSKLALEIDPQMQIFGLSGIASDDSVYSPTGGKTLILRFLPPDGKWEVGEVAADNKFTMLSLKNINFSLRYGSDTDPNYQREINFDLTNMKASITYAKFGLLPPNLIAWSPV